jgi:hypothetical protein
MPTQKSKSGRTFARHVAPFAPLALALGMNAVPSNNTAPPENPPGLVEQDIPDNISAVKCDENIADSQECHANYPTGCSKAAGYDAYLNSLKNLTPMPTTGVNFLDQSAFDNLNSSTPSELGQGNNHATYKDQLSQLGEGKQFGIVGYLYYYQATGAESSNCELTGPDANGGNVDFHIGIGFDSSLASQVDGNSRPAAALKKQLQQNSVIVEMTPHYRARFEDGVWTLANLKPALGHKVRVIGQLLVDSEHNKPTDNCAVKGTAAQANHCWRYSIWELHPVTSFEYCANDSCTEATNNWTPIGGSAMASAGGGSSGDGSDETSTAGATSRPRSSTRTAEPRSDRASRP